MPASKFHILLADLFILRDILCKNKAQNPVQLSFDRTMSYDSSGVATSRHSQDNKFVYLCLSQASALVRIAV